MRIAIYGTGGLGGYYGVRLADAGHDVSFIARGVNLAAMREHGLRVLSPLGDTHLENPVASDNPADIGPVDAVLVAVKTWQVEDVARAMAPLIGDNTVVVPFLNGVEAPDQLAAVLGPKHAAGGLSKIFSLLEAPGVIRHFNDAAIVAFNELDGVVTPRIEALKAAFEDAGVTVETPGDIRRALWEKLMMVTSWAGIGALARAPLGTLRDDKRTRALINDSIAETIAVANAHGIAIPASFGETLWGFYNTLPAHASASLMRDIMAGKPSELAAWNGAVHRLGAEVGIPTPTHSLIYSLLTPMERVARGELTLPTG